MTDQNSDSTPLERMMLGALKGEKKFEFSLRGLEPEDIDRILYAFLCVHVFGSKFDSDPGSNESFSAIKKLCEVHEIEPVFESREYPALRRGRTTGHKIILLPDSGNHLTNEKRALEIIKYFSALESTSITETIIGLIEKFDEADIIRYVERYNSNLTTSELEVFRQRMVNRQSKRLKSESKKS